jgi:hypothetical protein
MQVIQVHEVNTNTSYKDDGATASSMCMRIEVNGVPVGPALVDQGANRSIMRRSAFERAGLEQVATLWPVNNYQVKTASNHLIPITGRFMANITSNGESFNDEAVVYVVDDVTDKGKDISCDVVVGRHTIANSAYRLLDTLQARGEARQTSRVSPVSAVCTNTARRWKDGPRRTRTGCH